MPNADLQAYDQGMLRPLRGLRVSESKSPWPTRSDLIDLAAALGAAAFVAVATLAGNHNPGQVGVYVLTNVAMMLPLAFRRRLPVSTVIAILAVIVVEAATIGPSDGLGALALLVACYTVATYRPWVPATVALVVVVPAFAIANWVSGKGLADDVDFVFVLCVAAWLAGRGVRSRQLLVDRLAAQSSELRAAREAEAAAMAATERSRIARDLHDVLAHSISVIVVQAEAAEALLPDLERNRRALQAVQRTARSALVELRQLLDVLHNDDPDDRQDETRLRLPSPRLRDADRLVRAMREAGLDVTLHIDGEAVVPEGADLAAYRILQEAMTNALRHAGPTTVEADVHIDDHQVLVSVVDHGPTGRTRITTGRGTGHGLRGMRARVHMYGGDFLAGPSGEGFRVVARIPVQSQA
jgi:signal transduction histidine kinase